MTINENEVYTPQETASILKISDSTFRRLIKKGILKAYKVGGQYRILGKELLSLFGPVVRERAFEAYRKVKDKTRRTLNV